MKKAFILDFKLGLDIFSILIFFNDYSVDNNLFEDAVEL